MKKIIWYILIIIGSIPLILSCDQESSLPDKMIDNLGGFDNGQETELDRWIYENWTKPFNVQLKYKYDPFEMNFMNTSVPPKQDYVIPIAEMVGEILVDPLLEMKDSTFVRQIIPRLWVLLGSGEYQPDGSVVLGTAEVGNKVTIMEVNNFDPKDREHVEWKMYVVMHEFGHTLHQRILYPVNFKYINPMDYTTTWSNVSDADARKNGFVRNYAMGSPDEDFVETIAFLLCRGQASFDQLVNSANEEGKSRFITKERIIVEYFEKSFGINFRSWQKLVRDNITAYLDRHNN